MERKILHAADGMVLTNGTIYGKIIYLAEGADESAFYYITQEEYDAMANDTEAEAADYAEALGRFGVR